MQWMHFLSIISILKCIYGFTSNVNPKTFQRFRMTNADSAKRNLLSSISMLRKRKDANDLQRREIFSCVESLEQLQSQKIHMENLNGTWSLIYSSKISDSQDSFEFVDRITSFLYSLFFKVAPFLAGSQERSSVSDFVTVYF